MAKKPPVPCLTSIGETAGAVWRALSENGPMTMAKLVKGAGASRDMVTLAVGWLARENKIDIEQERSSYKISLR